MYPSNIGYTHDTLYVALCVRISWLIPSKRHDHVMVCTTIKKCSMSPDSPPRMRVWVWERDYPTANRCILPLCKPHPLISLLVESHISLVSFPDPNPHAGREGSESFLGCVLCFSGGATEKSLHIVVIRAANWERGHVPHILRKIQNWSYKLLSPY